MHLLHLGEPGARTLSHLWWFDGCATCRAGPGLLSRSHRCTAKRREKTPAEWRSRATNLSKESYQAGRCQTCLGSAINERARVDNRKENCSRKNASKDD